MGLSKGVINIFNRQYIANPLFNIVVHNYQTLKLFRTDTKNQKVQLESVDDFTSKLLQTKSSKWQNKQEFLNKISSNSISVPYVDRKYNDNETCSSCNNINREINIQLRNAIDTSDQQRIRDLINTCTKSHYCPPTTILINIFSICSHNGDKDTIDKLISLCDQVSPQLLEQNSHFRHYVAEVIWIKGNIKKSLDLFLLVYEENPLLRPRIQTMLKYLINNVVLHRSEASLVNVIRFSETLYQKYNDFYPLRCIWQECFLSDWYTDQCLALELLEKHEKLRNAIETNVPYVVSSSLHFHRTDVLYRLLEIFLKYDIKEEYKFVLIALLEYQSMKLYRNKCTLNTSFAFQFDREIRRGAWRLSSGPNRIISSFFRSST